jgi:hypothetical protein
MTIRELNRSKARLDPESRAGPVLAITRITFAHWWIAAIAFCRFVTLYRSARRNTALLRGSVAFSGPHTLINLSIWNDVRSLLAWSGTNEHVQAVQWSYTHVSEVWSAISVVDYVSPSARHWRGVFAPELHAVNQAARQDTHSEHKRADAEPSM